MTHQKNDTQDKNESQVTFEEMLREKLRQTVGTALVLFIAHGTMFGLCMVVQFPNHICRSSHGFFTWGGSGFLSFRSGSEVASELVFFFLKNIVLGTQRSNRQFTSTRDCSQEEKWFILLVAHGKPSPESLVLARQVSKRSFFGVF
jgi:hypothetical protein